MSITVTILNWQKFNPRKDVNKASWLRLENTLFQDHELYDFTHTEIVAWLYLLCLASQKYSDTVLLNYAHAERIGRIKEKDMNLALQKLELIQCIKVCVTDSEHADVTHKHADVTATVRPRALRNDTIRNETKTLADSGKFDFESVYKKYPRKEGKQEGLRRCRAQIKTQEDFNSLVAAVAAYSTNCIKNGTEPKFIKHFSSFMTAWRDWSPQPADNTPVCQNCKNGIFRATNKSSGITEFVACTCGKGFAMSNYPRWDQNKFERAT